MAGPRLLAMLLQGDELFHCQIGEACRTPRPDIICIHLVRFQGDELLHGQIPESCLLQRPDVICIDFIDLQSSHLLSCESGESRWEHALVWPLLRISKALSAKSFQ